MNTKKPYDSNWPEELNSQPRKYVVASSRINTYYRGKLAIHLRQMEMLTTAYLGRYDCDIDEYEPTVPYHWQIFSY